MRLILFHPLKFLESEDIKKETIIEEIKMELKVIESKLSESDKGTEKEASGEPIKKKKRFLGYGLSDVDEKV